ncbi:hypothetical protein ACHAWF_018750 [Thalassiosira exigua]
MANMGASAETSERDRIQSKAAARAKRQAAREAREAKLGKAVEAPRMVGYIEDESSRFFGRDASKASFDYPLDKEGKLTETNNGCERPNELSAGVKDEIETGDLSEEAEAVRDAKPSAIVSEDTASNHSSSSVNSNDPNDGGGASKLSDSRDVSLLASKLIEGVLSSAGEEAKDVTPASKNGPFQGSPQCSDSSPDELRDEDMTEVEGGMKRSGQAVSDIDHADLDPTADIQRPTIHGSTLKIEVPDGVGDNGEGGENVDASDIISIGVDELRSHRHRVSDIGEISLPKAEMVSGKDDKLGESDRSLGVDDLRHSSQRQGSMSSIISDISLGMSDLDMCAPNRKQGGTLHSSLIPSKEKTAAPLRRSFSVSDSPSLNKSDQRLEFKPKQVTKRTRRTRVARLNDGSLAASNNSFTSINFTDSFVGTKTGKASAEDGPSPSPRRSSTDDEDIRPSLDARAVSKKLGSIVSSFTSKKGPNDENRRHSIDEGAVSKPGNAEERRASVGDEPSTLRPSDVINSTVRRPSCAVSRASIDQNSGARRVSIIGAFAGSVSSTPVQRRSTSDSVALESLPEIDFSERESLKGIGDTEEKNCLDESTRSQRSGAFPRFSSESGDGEFSQDLRNSQPSAGGFWWGKYHARSRIEMQPNQFFIPPPEEDGNFFESLFYAWLRQRLHPAIFFSKLERVLTRASVTFSSSASLQFGQASNFTRGSKGVYGQFWMKNNSIRSLASIETDTSKSIDSSDARAKFRRTSLVRADATHELRNAPYPFLEFRIVNDHANYKNRAVRNAEVSAMVQLSVQDSENVGYMRLPSQGTFREYVASTTSHKDSTHSNLSPTEEGSVSKTSEKGRGKELFAKRGSMGPSLRATAMEVQETDMDGEKDKGAEGRIYYPLNLEPKSHPYFRRVWYIRHTLNEKSPLLKRHVREQIKRDQGWSASRHVHQDIRSSLVDFHRIRLTFKGTSAMSNAMVFSQKVYTFEDVYIGWQFGQIFHERERWKWLKFWAPKKMLEEDESNIDEDDLVLDKRLIHDILPQSGGGQEPIEG